LKLDPVCKLTWQSVSASKHIFNVSSECEAALP
jgi:hypothetical protein